MVNYHDNINLWRVSATRTIDSKQARVGEQSLHQVDVSTHSSRLTVTDSEEITYFDNVTFLCEGKRSTASLLCHIKGEKNMALVVIKKRTADL